MHCKLEAFPYRRQFLDHESGVVNEVRTVNLKKTDAFGFITVASVSSFFTIVQPFFIRVVLSVASFAKQELLAYSAEIEDGFHSAVKLFLEMTHRVIQTASKQHLALEVSVKFDQDVHVNASILFTPGVTTHPL